MKLFLYTDIFDTIRTFLLIFALLKEKKGKKGIHSEIPTMISNNHTRVISKT